MTELPQSVDELPAYRWESQCPKCETYGEHHTHYRSAKKPRYWPSMSDEDEPVWLGFEHLVRICRTCGFTWFEQTADA